MRELSVGKKSVLSSNAVNFDERQVQLEKQKEEERKAKERAKKSPYERFVQMNEDFYKAEDWLMAKSPIAYRIFKFLINQMDHYNAVVCSQTVLQENFNISRTTVSRAIKLLKEKGYVAVFKSGTSNVYAINDKIAWKSWGINYPNSKFPANVVLSISEQEKSVQAKLKAIKHKEVQIDEQ